MPPGLKDVAALAEVVVDAARLGMDLGQADVLERYQRWRRFDTMAMGLATNSLNLLFSNESTLLRTVRDIGLGLVDRAPPLKSMFIRQAAGLAGEVPRLLKGEALWIFVVTAPGMEPTDALRAELVQRVRDGDAAVFFLEVLHDRQHRAPYRRRGPLSPAAPSAASKGRTPCARRCCR